MEIYFDHEKLDVYREAIAFCGWVGELLGTINARAAVKDQLDRASTSIPLNIAEGNGKFSALECAACLDVMVVRGLAAEGNLAVQKERLSRIVQMLMGMLRKFSERADFLQDEVGNYLAPAQIDYEHEHACKEGR